MRTFKALLLVLGLAAAAMAAADIETRTLSGFDRVVFALPGQLTLVRGERHEVILEARPDDLERIVTVVSGGELTLRWDDGLLGWGGGPDGEITARVTLPALAGVTVAGSGSVAGTSWEAPALALEVRGSGDLQFAELASGELTVDVAGSGNVGIERLEAASVRVAVKGSGDVTLAGVAQTQVIEVTGSGDVDAAGLRGARLVVEIRGSGDVDVWATEQLVVAIMGSGDVGYRGEPRLERELRGSGRVRSL